MEARTTSHLNVTDPPTAHRLHLLRRRPQPSPSVAVEPALMARVDAELATLHRTVRREIVDAHRNRSYWRAVWVR